MRHFIIPGIVAVVSFVAAFFTFSPQGSPVSALFFVVGVGAAAWAGVALFAAAIRGTAREISRGVQEGKQSREG